MRHLGRFILISVLTGFVVSGGAAQEKPDLEGTLRFPSMCWRTEAPAVADLELRWAGRDLLHGRLEVVVSDAFGARALARVKTNELTLASGVQTVALLLPAVGQSAADKLTIRLRFRTAHRTFELGRIKLPVAGEDVHTQVVAFCTTTTGLGDRLERVAGSLSLERLLRAGLAGVGSVPNPSLATGRVRLAPDDLPSSPLPLCAFDLLVVDVAALGRARHEQLTALAAWIEAGGSFCLVADRFAGLRAHHLAFLNRLAAGTGRRLTRAPDGSVSVSAPEGRWGTPWSRVSILRCHPGLGRAVLLRRPMDDSDSLTTRDRCRAAAFLWKIKHKHVESIAEGKRLPGVAEDPVPFEGLGQEGEAALDFSVQYLGALGMFHWLLPADVQLIPWWLLSIILLGFMLVIGPGEYRLVRRLRRGGLTWLIFPVVCFATAFLLVELSRVFLGGDTRRALVIVDVGEGGRELRRTRLDLVFLARPEIDERRMTDRLCVGVDPSRYSDGVEFGTGFRGRLSAATGGLELTGDYPDRFALRRRIEQWAPQITRTTAIGTGAGAGGIDWALADQRWRRPDGLVGVDLGPAAVHVERYALGHRKVVRSTLRDDGGSEDGSGDLLDTVAEVAEVVYALSAHPRKGLFAVVSQISPTGGGSLEDLAVLDESDNRQVLLVVITHEGEDIVVHRRLYREEARSGAATPGGKAWEER